MNKSVLFIAPSAYPLGGVQTWLDYMLPGIGKHGFDSTLALPDGKFHNAQTYLGAHPFQSVELLDNPTGSIQGRHEAIRRVIKKVDPELILVVNIFDVYPAINDLRAHYSLHAKVVTTIHGIHPGLINDIDSYADVIDGVISTNKLTQKLVNNNTMIDSSRSHYAPYGVANQAVARELHEKFTIAYVGRFEESQKCIDDLLSILQKVSSAKPEIEILLAGDGPDLAQFKNWYARQNKPQNIRYLGVLTPDELNHQVYAKADVLLLTSSWETGPIVAWEAIRHGLTVVSSRYIGYLEEGSLKHKENCLMFDVGDTNEAVRQLIKADNAELRSRLNKNALALVENQYSIDSSIQSWVDCLNRISNNKPKEYARTIDIHRDKGLITDLLFKVFGPTGLSLSEKIRRILNKSFDHQEAGSEWPHCGRNRASDYDANALNSYIE